MITTEQSPSVLREFVERFRVCWEVWPEYITLRGEKRQVGFNLELSGSPESETTYPYPEWASCQRVFSGLRRLAEAILPREKRPSGYEIVPYDQALHYSRLRGNRPEVTVSIRIFHRQDFEQPVDDCEIRCLTEMEQRLKELGACERQWVSNGSEHH